VALAGRWPDVVDVLASRDVERIALEREDGIVQQRPHVVLLEHMHEVWPAAETFVSTEDLIGQLVTNYPEMWSEQSTYGKRLTAQRMGRMLVTAYNIHSDRRDRADGSKVRGYRRSTLAPAFARFGMTLPVEPAGPVEAVEPVRRTDGYTPPSGPDRCPTCGWHVPTQGHTTACTERVSA